MPTQSRLDTLQILVTGFEPFGGARFNPSGEVATNLHGQTIHGHPVVGRILPVVWDVAPKLLGDWIEELCPNIVVSLGMAQDCIEIETRATNHRHPARRDNLGALPNPPRAIATHEFQTTLPVGKLVPVLSVDGSVQVSEDAGGFLCEEVFYALMSKHAEVQTSQRFAFLRAGFVHVPNDEFITDDAAQRSLEKRILRALETIVEDMTLA